MNGKATTMKNGKDKDLQSARKRLEKEQQAIDQLMAFARKFAEESEHRLKEAEEKRHALIEEAKRAQSRNNQDLD